MYRWNVHKFGGSSLANAERFRLIKSFTENNLLPAIVVSAVQGTTSALEHCVKRAIGKKEFQEPLYSIKHMHLELVEQLLPLQKQAELKAVLQIDTHRIEDLLKAISLFGLSSEEAFDAVMSYGERWSAQILAAHLNWQYIDATTCLYIDKSRQNHIEWERSKTALNHLLTEQKPFVFTGYIASTTEGKTTTLGRNGSDYSASIVANLLNAESLTIWTDVDGVMSANPKIVPSAFVLNELSYEEAFELAYFGASVIHPNTMAPAISKHIPIRIKNSYNPNAEGTLISNHARSAHVIKGLTSIDNIALINVEGSGMIGVSGVAARVFQTMQHADISVILITQASSEHSICFAVNHLFAEKAVQYLNEHFYYELQENKIQRISAENNCAIIAAVGDNMVGQLGVAAKVGQALSDASVNIKAIAQGSSERNISLVVAEAQVARAIRAIHSSFHLSKRTFSIGIIGPGLIGSTLLQQFAAEKERLRDQFDLDIRVRGIMNSKKMVLSNEQISLTSWENELLNSGQTSDLHSFLSHVNADDIPHSVIIDCTSSQTIADSYLEMIQHGLHIITPNKKANTSSLNYYKALKHAEVVHKKHYLYETTVGAGLPIIKTLDDLIQTGDKVLHIEGIFSGTLAYIFDRFNGEKSFSEIVKEAKAKGYTEPDPRDDLSGMDVARKVVTLARQMGKPAALEDVKLEPLIPETLANCDVEEFMNRLHEFDSEMETVLQNATQKSETLRYVGSIHENGDIFVELKSYPKSHPFGRLQGSDNVVLFKTMRYDDQPLIVQGPGAGAEVTAAGVFADLLRLASLIS